MTTSLGASRQTVFSTYQFRAPSYYYAVEKRDASLIALGELAVEPLAPAFNTSGWEQAPPGRFYQPFGRRWHSLSWYVDEGVGDLQDRLDDAGVPVFGAAGRNVTSDGGGGPTFTHPRDTAANLSFARPDSGRLAKSCTWTPRLRGSFDATWWSHHHHLRIVKWSHHNHRRSGTVGFALRRCAPRSPPGRAQRVSVPPSATPSSSSRNRSAPDRLPMTSPHTAKASLHSRSRWPTLLVPVTTWRPASTAEIGRSDDRTIGRWSPLLRPPGCGAAFTTATIERDDCLDWPDLQKSG